MRMQREDLLQTPYLHKLVVKVVIEKMTTVYLEHIILLWLSQLDTLDKIFYSLFLELP
jgi:hypothetical protein